MKKRLFDSEMKAHRFNLDKLSLTGVLAAIVATGGVLLIAAAFLTRGSKSASAATTALLCSLTSSSGGGPGYPAQYDATPMQLKAILHYATSRVVPQQTLAEVRLSFDVLMELSPCNFLVFGLGYDSLMWAGLNPRGTTVFLEEDPKWLHTVSERNPSLRAFHVNYNTQLSEADDLLSVARDDPECAPDRVRLGSRSRCRLMLPGLPDEIYDKEWDVIMIDAPRGYFPEAPGRMGAIFTAAAMAWRRVKPGVTHVFLHDVDRRVEKLYAKEFLCMSNKVEGTGRLWHFKISPSSNTSRSTFCS
ncbi:probable methyltransferase At1g27930 [Punica granatum]|uniref:Uncharacterized protein n=2 Tax=Punica granatum TaxID=22663 RepID=A0A218WF16_PUNGR|nr:probable methyltransferase At1g27930 [Punica granatum]OWM71427.1 hypothetical protein CDL15_Pgr005614 [Punica granatum]PKI60336.1 hypothetical protein CRG98_019272 [Punica granatum]